MQAHDVMVEIINTGRIVDPVKWTPAQAVAKLFEEGGELSEAVQVVKGDLIKDKGITAEDIFLEGADVIMCAVDVVSQMNLDLSPEEIIERLMAATMTKLPGWKAKIYKSKKNREDNSLVGWEYYDPKLGIV